MITTSFEQNKAVMTHMGTSGCTVTTARREFDDGPVVSAEVEAHVATAEEGITLIAVLLIYMEQQYSEEYVAEGIGLYAAQTGKKTYREGGKHVTIIKGQGIVKKTDYWEEPAP